MPIDFHYPAVFIFSHRVITGRTNQNKSCQNGFQDLMPTGKGDNENTREHTKSSGKDNEGFHPNVCGMQSMRSFGKKEEEIGGGGRVGVVRGGERRAALRR